MDRFYFGIGTSDYPGFDRKDLPGVSEDLERMQGIFVDRLDFQPLLSPFQGNNKSLENAILEIGKWKRSKPEGTETVLIFYYSGHGKLAGNDEFLLADKSAKEDADESLIPISKLFHAVVGGRITHFLVILDTCQSQGGAVDLCKAFRHFSTTQSEEPKIIAHAITATRKFEVAKDSLFSTAFQGAVEEIDCGDFECIDLETLRDGIK